jgi:hypothetical protein
MESLDPEKPACGWMLWPFVGHYEIGKMSSWSYFWPLFQFASNEKGGSGVNIFWPFFQYRKALERGGNDFKLYFWPFWGQKSSGGSASSFIFWPFVGWGRDGTAYSEISKFRVFPFWWMKDISDKNGKSIESHMIFWPFFAFQAKGEDSSLKVLDFFPERILSGVDRNWAPLWAFFDYRSSAKGFSYDVFWGMLSGYGAYQEKKERFSIAGIYDSKTEGEGSRQDFLCGIFSVHSKEGEENRYKLFWLLEF